jgi:hypothetical protein
MSLKDLKLKLSVDSLELNSKILHLQFEEVQLVLIVQQILIEDYFLEIA